MQIGAANLLAAQQAAAGTACTSVQFQPLEFPRTARPKSPEPVLKPAAEGAAGQARRPGSNLDIRV